MGPSSPLSENKRGQQQEAQEPCGVGSSWLDLQPEGSGVLVRLSTSTLTHPQLQEAGGSGPAHRRVASRPASPSPVLPQNCCSHLTQALASRGPSPPLSAQGRWEAWRPEYWLCKPAVREAPVRGCPSGSFPWTRRC